MVVVADVKSVGTLVGRSQVIAANAIQQQVHRELVA